MFVNKLYLDYSLSCLNSKRACKRTPWTSHCLRFVPVAGTGQVADATGNFACLSFRSFGGICETASCPVRDLSSPRVGNPRIGVSASCPIRHQSHMRSLAFLQPEWTPTFADCTAPSIPRRCTRAALEVFTSGVQTLRTQDSSDPRHFGTSAELSGHFGPISVVPKCLGSEVSVHHW